MVEWRWVNYSWSCSVPSLIHWLKLKAKQNVALNHYVFMLFTSDLFIDLLSCFSADNWQHTDMYVHPGALRSRSQRENLWASVHQCKRSHIMMGNGCLYACCNHIGALRSSSLVLCDSVWQGVSAFLSGSSAHLHVLHPHAFLKHYNLHKARALSLCLNVWNETRPVCA